MSSQRGQDLPYFKEAKGEFGNCWALLKFPIKAIVGYINTEVEYGCTKKFLIGLSAMQLVNLGIGPRGRQFPVPRGYGLVTIQNKDKKRIAIALNFIPLASGRDPIWPHYLKELEEKKALRDNPAKVSISIRLAESLKVQVGDKIIITDAIW